MNHKCHVTINKTSGIGLHCKINHKRPTGMLRKLNNLHAWE